MEEKMIFDDDTNKSVFPNNPLDNLSDTELQFLLDHNKDVLSEAQIIEIEAKLSRMEDHEFTQDLGRSLILTPQKNKRIGRAGFVDVIILMLTTWFMCLLGMTYVYVKLGIMS